VLFAARQQRKIERLKLIKEMAIAAQDGEVQRANFAKEIAKTATAEGDITVTINQLARHVIFYDRVTDLIESKKLKASTIQQAMDEAYNVDDDLGNRNAFVLK